MSLVVVVLAAIVIWQIAGPEPGRNRPDDEASLSSGEVAAADLESAADRALAAVEASVEFARQSPFPDPATVVEGVMAEDRGTA